MSWALPAAIFATVLLGLATSYSINIWNRAIFDALERRDAGTVVFWSIVYFPLLAASVCLVIGQVYARMTMQRRWRAWLNNHLLDRWLTEAVHLGYAADDVLRLVTERVRQFQWQAPTGKKS